jgi:hypothetical protein
MRAVCICEIVFPWYLDIQRLGLSIHALINACFMHLCDCFSLIPGYPKTWAPARGYPHRSTVDRQTDRQKNVSNTWEGQTDRERDRKTQNGEISWEGTDRETDRQTDGRTDGKTDRQMRAIHGEKGPWACARSISVRLVHSFVHSQLLCAYFYIYICIHIHT